MLRSFLIFSLALLGACKSRGTPAPDAPEPSRPAPPPAETLAFDERAIEYTDSMQIDRAAAPARFAAALPRTDAEMEAFRKGDASFPARDHVRNALCASGRPDVLVRVDEAITQGGNQALARWLDLVSDCGGTRFCAIAGPIVAGGARPVRDLLAPTFKEMCEGGQLDADEAQRRSTVESRLRGTGLIGAEPLRLPAELEGDDLAFETLVAAGRADAIDAEASRVPNEHDRVMRRLAHLVHPDLDGALFVEVAPATEGGPYVLEAYLDGQRYTTKARNDGKWYDLDAAVGLVNSVLRARNSERRILALAGGGQLMLVAAGRPHDLSEAVRAGLLHAYDGREQ